jgi:site-specific recombinase XerD
MDEFVEGYCSEPRLALNRALVLRYRQQLEGKKLAASTINVRLAAVRRLAYEAADTGLLSPELVGGIRCVKGVSQLGRRVGNWLSVQQGADLLSGTTAETLRQKRDGAIISLLLGCGLRRSEVVALNVGDIQKREDHWAIVDLFGKAGHVRTVPVPAWVKTAVDRWAESATISTGRLFRSIRKNGTVWGNGITQNVVWYVVKACAARAGITALAPHDLRAMPNTGLCRIDVRERQSPECMPPVMRHGPGGEHGTCRRKSCRHRTPVDRRQCSQYRTDDLRIGPPRDVPAAFLSGDTNAVRASPADCVCGSVVPSVRSCRISRTVWGSDGPQMPGLHSHSA